MSELEIPQSLPSEYARIWRLLSTAHRRSGSRHRLAKRLRVSTHTLQRILVDGDVPELGEGSSRRQCLAWVRTIARIASGLKEDPWEHLEEIGVKRTEELQRVVSAEMAKLEGVSRHAAPEAGNITGRLASLLLGSLPGGDGDSRQLAESLKDYLRRSKDYAPRRADGGELEEGRFCLSCMSSLSDPENRGKAKNYCRWCSDKEGRLLPRDEALDVMTDWFQSWQAGLSREEARRRADLYMRAMPAWNPTKGGEESRR